MAEQLGVQASDRPIRDAVLQFFREDHWKYQYDPDRAVIRAGFRGEHGTWVCYAQADEENRRFIFHSLMGLNILPQDRSAVAEYLTRVNCRLPVGNFELDFDTGAVRFKTSVETPECELTLAMVRALAHINVRTMERYYPGVQAIIHRGYSAQAALALVEAQA